MEAFTTPVMLGNPARKRDARHRDGWWRGSTAGHAAVGFTLGVAIGVTDFLRVLPLALVPDESLVQLAFAMLFRWALIGLCIGVLLAVLERSHLRGWRRIVLVCVALTAGGALLVWSDITISGLNEYIQAGMTASRLSLFLYMYWLTIAFASLGLLLQLSARRSREATQRLRAAEMDRQAAQKNVVESQLNAMQARIEPQFLFDALDRVQQAYLRSPGGAERQLDHLIAYLRAALPQLREDTSTLTREAALIEAYLRVVDEGTTTSFEDATPVELKPVALPPMLLLPLVQAAQDQTSRNTSADHRVVLGARVSGSRLEVSLRIGAAATTAALDAALERTQDTLRALYADAAEISVVRPTPTSVQVRLVVPHEL